MNVDLSRSIYDAYRKAVGRADEFERAGQSARAASVYREAAKLARHYADYATGRGERTRRTARARALETLAERLACGGRPAGPPPEKPSTFGSDGTGTDQERELTAQIEALVTHTDLAWRDIGGLEQTKREIQLAFGIAVARKPHGVDVNIVRNILLYGPPGTGKSLLASAISGELDAAFFNVRVSGVLSKWFGDSPRLVSKLYEVARQRAPSVVFMDELESLFPSRGALTSGPERRLLSALLSEISGVSASGESPTVFTVGATNAPWLMDAAALSRFGRRIYVPLPDASVRRAVLEIHLTRKGHTLDFPVDRLVQATEGLSGRQLAHLAARAVEHMLADTNADLPDVASRGREKLREYSVRTRTLGFGDFQAPLAAVKPDTSPETVCAFEEW